MPIQYRKGNLLDALLNNEVDVLVHGCNCYTTMGAGIAKQIKDYFPQAYRFDMLYDKSFTYENPKDKSKKLGSFSYVMITRKPKNCYIVNAYTQDTYWDRKRMLSYDAVKKAFKSINEFFKEPLTIGMPFIGCGLANGEWKEVSKIIEEVFNNRDVYVYYLKDSEFLKNLYNKELN